MFYLFIITEYCRLLRNFLHLHCTEPPDQENTQSVGGQKDNGKSLIKYRIFVNFLFRSLAVERWRSFVPKLWSWIWPGSMSWRYILWPRIGPKTWKLLWGRFRNINLSKLLIPLFFSEMYEDLPEDYPRILHLFDIWHWIKVQLIFLYFRPIRIIKLFISQSWRSCSKLRSSSLVKVGIMVMKH